MALQLAVSPPPSLSRAIVRRTRGRLTDSELVLGSAAPHEHDLLLGYYSVHTSPSALRDGEAQISLIKRRLVQEGRL